MFYVAAVVTITKITIVTMVTKVTIVIIAKIVVRKQYRSESVGCSGRFQGKFSGGRGLAV